jgi:hypothetical protein
MRWIAIVALAGVALYYRGERDSWKRDYFSDTCADAQIIAYLRDNTASSYAYARMIRSDAAEWCREKEWRAR